MVPNLRFTMAMAIYSCLRWRIIQQQINFLFTFTKASPKSDPLSFSCITHETGRIEIILKTLI